ncbi:MAG: NAD(P)-binding domain-containing protein [Pseudonocardiaceae bacterium]
MTRLGIVGAGAVGQALATAVVAAGRADVAVLSRTDWQSAALSADLEDLCAALCSPVAVRSVNSVAELRDCDAIVIAVRAAFTNRHQLDVRMAGLSANATIVHKLAVELTGYTGAVLVVTNPVDVLARLVAETSTCHRVYGIGANLDTARYRTLVAAACGVAVEVVNGHVIGEHGDAAVCCLSSTTIRGHPLDSAAVPAGDLYAALHARSGLITDGIGRVRAGAVGAILSALGKVLGEVDGVEHLSVRYRHHGWLGLPVRFTCGAAQPFLPPLNPDEQRRLAAAADKVHHAYQTLVGSTLASTAQPPTSTRETR